MDDLVCETCGVKCGNTECILCFVDRFITYVNPAQIRLNVDLGKEEQKTRLYIRELELKRHENGRTNNINNLAMSILPQSLSSSIRSHKPEVRLRQVV